MSKIVIKNKWDGGNASDVRMAGADQAQDMQGFDIFTNPSTPTPYGDSVAETVTGDTMDHLRLGAVFNVIIGTTPTLLTVGFKSNSDVRGTCYTKANINDTWGANGDGAIGYALTGKPIFYKGKVYFLGLNGTSYNLQRCDGGATVTSIGTFTVSAGTTPVMFVHPLENILYIVITGSIITYDGTTLASPFTTLMPTGFTLKAMCDYGIYMAMAMTDGITSKVYLWGRDVTLNTFQGELEFGEGQIEVLVNLQNVLFGVMVNNPYALSSLNPKLKIKTYSGGAVETLYDLQTSSNLNITDFVNNGGRLYFTANADPAVWCFAKNRNGKYVLTHDRYVTNGAANGSTNFISFVGDVCFIGSISVGGVYSLMRSKINGLGETITYNNSAYFLSTINPNMVVAERYLSKKLVGLRVAYSAKNGGTLSGYYQCDGASLVQVYNETFTATKEDVKIATMDINDKQLLDAMREVNFKLLTTGGVCLKEIYYVYDVLDEVI